jgi:hypothetical protein
MPDATLRGGNDIPRTVDDSVHKLVERLLEIGGEAGRLDLDFK